MGKDRIAGRASFISRPNALAPHAMQESRLKDTMMNRHTETKQTPDAATARNVAQSIHVIGLDGELIDDRPADVELESMAGFGGGFMEEFFSSALSVATVRNGKFADGRTRH
jgi:hypothetical protein